MSASSLGHAFRTTARVLLLGLTALIPLFGLPFSLDPFELPKQTLFLIVVTAASACLLAAFVFERKALVRTSLLLLPPIFFLCALLASAAMSSSPYLSWLGAQGQTVASVATTAGCILYVCCFLQLFPDEASRRRLFGMWMGGGGLAVACGLLWYVGVYPLRFLGIETVSGNPVGTMNALGFFAASLAAAASAFWVTAQGKGAWILRLVAFLTAIVSLFFLLCVDYSPTWGAFFVGQLIVLLPFFIRPERAVHPMRLLLPFLTLAIALPFVFLLASPFARTLPSDVTPSTATSLTIATDAVADAPWLGAGPNTYQAVYAEHHSEEINQTPFWDVRFDRASSYSLTLLSTIGLVGFGMWLLLLLSGVACVTFSFRPQVILGGGELAAMGMFAALFTTALLYPYNFTLLAAFFLAYSILLFPSVREVAIAHTHAPRRHAVLVAVSVLSALLLLFFLFLAVQRLISEAAFAQAVRSDRENGSLQDVVSSLDRSASLNRFDDAHYRVLSEALLLRVGEELARLNAAPSASDAERRYVQALIGASVNASVRATELAPRNVQNWLTRGRVYRELIGFGGKEAEIFAREAFARAHALEPASPVPLFEAGFVERTVADVALRLTNGKDDSQTQADAALEASEAFFLQSLALKPDYAPSVFQLSLVYERQGKLNEAISNIERITIQTPNDLGALFELGILYLRRGAEGDAMRADTAFTQALVLAPTFSNARWFLASALEREGKRDEAMAALQQILRYDPENELVKNRIERLTNSTAIEPIPTPIP